MLDRFLIYQPFPWVERHWAQMSGLPLEDVWLTVSPGVRVFGWYVNAGPHQPVVLWCHGNAGNISNRLDNLADLFRLRLSVFLFDYRGYGKSTGSPTEQGLYQDALAAYDYLIIQRKVAPKNLVLFGRSLGGAVAAEIAIQRPAAGLIVEGSFPSVQAMADLYYWGLPARWFVEGNFNLAQKVSRLSLPILVVHGDRDTIVPLQLGRKVYEAAQHPKSWYTVSGAGHNDVPFVGGHAYYQQLLAFIKKVVG